MDKEIVKPLTELLSFSLNLPAAAIRCTSIDGHGLEVGAEIEQELRKEIQDANVFIVVITANSMDSTYVVFELGARWGAKKPLWPLLAHGADNNLLKGPLASINALRSDNPADLFQLVEEMAKALGVRPQPSASYQHYIDKIVHMPNQKFHDMEQLFNQESITKVVVGKQGFAENSRNLLREYNCCIATVRTSMIAHYSKGMGGYFMHACNQLFEEMRTERFKHYHAMISIPRCRSDYKEGRMSLENLKSRLKNLQMCLDMEFKHKNKPIFHPRYFKIIPSTYSHITQTHLYYNDNDREAANGTLLLMLQDVQGDMNNGIMISHTQEIVPKVKKLMEGWIMQARNKAGEMAEECGFDISGRKADIYNKYKEKLYPEVTKLDFNDDLDLKCRIWLVEKYLPEEIKNLK